MNVIPIETLQLPELEPFLNLTEHQLRQKTEEERGIFIAESLKVIRIALEAGFRPLSFLTESRHLAALEPLLASFPDVPVYTGAPELLQTLTGYRLNRGVLCAFPRPALPSVTEVLRGATRIAVLEEISDAVNVGAIFRSAAALGIDAVLLTPTCCHPLVRRAARVSMGTVFQVPWTYLPAWPDGLLTLKELGFITLSLALKPDSRPLSDPSLKRYEKLALLLGTEGDGLKSSTLAATDLSVIIPMKNGVDSLNVASAAAVAFWELRH